MNEEGCPFQRMVDAEWIRLRGEALISHATISGGVSVMPDTSVLVISTEDDGANWTLINGRVMDVHLQIITEKYRE